MSQPKYLFDSLGTWIAFCKGTNLFGLHGDWLGWIEPANQNRVFDIDGEYLGTVVEDRLLREIVPPTASRDHPGYPGRTVPPDHPGYPGQFELPFNMEDAGLTQYV
jgi:hypothetical protein